MDSARADALSARSRLANGWIARNAEAFRHLPPPPAQVWLGDEVATPADEGDASAAAGWTLHPVGRSVPVHVDARWLDATDPAQRAELFAGLPAPGDDEAAPFAWAHRALCRQGLRLRIGAGDESAARRGERGTVWLQLRRQPRAAVEAPLLVVELLPGARCVLVESHEREDEDSGRATTQNLQVHVRLGAGASLRHLRVVAPGAEDRVAHHLRAVLAPGARYRQALLASGCAYHLQRNVFELQGERARAQANAVLFAAATALDRQVQTVHRARSTESAVEGLALASGRAQVVMHAHGRIEPGADNAVTRQRLTGIPTGGQPRLVLRPHLEIRHDQVQAAHGATWGALPEEALFYAAQRGLDERAARALIIEGLARAALAQGLQMPAALAESAAGFDIDRPLAAMVARHLAAEVRHG